MVENTAFRIGLLLPTHAPHGRKLDGELLSSVAEWAEAAGFDGLWAGDHIVHPWQFLEALTSLTFVAARTRKIGIGTCVLQLPMRQLAVAAAQIVTLSVLSDERFILGAGIGGEWPLEWQAAGVPTTERGARLDEGLMLLKKLLTGEAVDFAGRFNRFEGRMSPVPGRLPIHLAGRAPAALKRVGRIADGWIGFFVTPSGFRRDLAVIDAAREEAGRLGQPFERGALLNFHLDENEQRGEARAFALNFGFPKEITLAGSDEQLKRFALLGSAASIIARIREYAEAGCRNFVLSPVEKEGEAYQAQMRAFAERVLPALRS